MQEETMTLKVTIDLALCEGAELCGRVAPEVFYCDPYGKVIMEHVPDQLRPKIAIAVKQCPAFAISMEEE
jgi:ferredoxin